MVRKSYHVENRQSIGPSGPIKRSSDGKRFDVAADVQGMSWSAIRVQFESVELISMSLQHGADVRSSLAKTFMGLAVCNNNYLVPLRHSKNVFVVFGTDRIGNC